jgi:hypothetical protein
MSANAFGRSCHECTNTGESAIDGWYFLVPSPNDAHSGIEDLDEILIKGRKRQRMEAYR